MSRVLIVYGTTDGHTRKIADALAATFRDEGWDPAVYDAREISPRISPRHFERVIVAASLHGGRYQRAVGRWIRAHAIQLNNAHSAFLSVCLAVLDPDVHARDAAREIMKRFLHDCGWNPSAAMLVAGAVPYTRYGWIKRLIMRHILAKKNGDVDTKRDYDYTDWRALRQFAAAFTRTPDPAPPHVSDRSLPLHADLMRRE
jgi:menaquinone-dependent protoporphyrinogen oxidase